MSGLTRECGGRTTVRERLGTAAGLGDDAVVELEETFGLTVDKGRRRMDHAHDLDAAARSRPSGGPDHPGRHRGVPAGRWPVNHAIVSSLLMFSALQTGHAPFGYARWAAAAGWAALGNMVGGVGLVTLLRRLQVVDAVRKERQSPAQGVAVRDPREVR